MPRTRWCLAPLLLLAAPALRAQQLRGVVRDSVSGVGVAGAVVSVIDSTGSAAARTIADQAGRFRVASSPAAASLRVLRIGFTPRDVRLPTDRQESVTITMARLPALLASVQVSDRALCGASGDRGTALSLWEQARAGLLAAVVARDTKPGRMNVLLFTTEQAPHSRLVRRQTVRLESGTTGRPFVAAAKASDFAAHGYMQEGGSGRTFHAPDADILLDESFAATHCFTVAADADHPGQIGLAFQPAHERAGFVDVAGTLWIRRDVPALETLAFRFTGLEPAFESAGAGGSLTFRTMPNGLAYIERWSMRLPEVEATTSFVPDMTSALSRIGSRIGRERRNLKVAGIRTVGGEVTAAAWPDGSHAESPLGAVTGRVVAPGTAQPLDRVQVLLDGTADTVRTDSTGRFALLGVLPGLYTLQALDATLEPYVDPQTTSREVDVARDTVRGVTLQLSSRAEYFARQCPDDSLLTKTAVLLGRVTDAHGAPIPQLEVRGTWFQNFQTRAEGRFVTVTNAIRSVAPDRDGRFQLCVPRDRGLTFGVWRDSIRLAPDTSVTIADSDAQPFDWRVHVPPPDTTATFSGVVTADSSAAPLAGADVTLLPLGRSAPTMHDGSFALARVPPGRFLVRIRHVGYGMLRDTVTLAPRQRMARKYQLGVRMTILDTVSTVGSRHRYLSPMLRSFEDRRAEGFGHFIAEDELRAHDDDRLGTLIRAKMPGALLVPYAGSVFLASERGSSATLRPLPHALPYAANSPTGCWASVYLDGVRIYDVGQGKPAPDFNALNVDQYAGVEFYAGAATTPLEFSSPSGFDCGTLLLWTRER